MALTDYQKRHGGLLPVLLLQVGPLQPAQELEVRQDLPLHQPLQLPRVLRVRAR